MKKDWLEEKLRERLGTYNSPMDLEASWSELSKRRKKEKRRLPFLWLLGAGGLFVIGTAIFWTLTLSTNSQERALSFFPIEQETNAETVPAAKPMPKPPANTKSFLIPVKEQSGPPEHMLGEEVKAFLGTQKTREPEEAMVQLPLAGQTADTPPSDSFAKQQLSDKKTKGKELSPYFFSKKGLGLLQLKTDWKLISAPHIVLQTEALEISPISLSSFRKKRQPDWWLSASFTVGKFSRQLKNEPNDSISSPLLARRNRSEKALEAWSFSIDLRKKLNRRFFIQAGIRHHLSFEAFTDKYEKVSTKILENQVVQIIQRADGSTTEVRDAVEVNIKETTVAKMYTRQNLTEIPMLIGLDFSANDRLGMNVGVGGSYGFIHTKEGSVHQSATSAGVYESLSEAGYRKSNIWALQAQMDIYHRLTSGLQLFGGLQVKSYFNMAGKDAYFEERQQFLNAVLGVRVRIN